MEYKPILVDEGNRTLVRADLVFPDSYDANKGEYIDADGAVAALYIRVRKGSKEALDLLLELCGNYMNKYAFNALNELGKMGSVTDVNTRQGFARYVFDAYKSTDREKLEMIAFWSYPSFYYKEVDSSNKILFETTSEKEFVDRLIDEMYCAHSNGKPIQMRLTEFNNDFRTDVKIGNLISTFKFVFGEKTFSGIIRTFDM
jgi:hypothetical protein